VKLVSFDNNKVTTHFSKMHEQQMVSKQWAITYAREALPIAPSSEGCFPMKKGVRYLIRASESVKEGGVSNQAGEKTKRALRNKREESSLKHISGG